MNPKILIIFGVLCIHAISINGVDWSLAGGTLIATGASTTSTFALGPALVAGLLVAKVFGLGLLASRGNHGRRGKRGAEANEIEFVTKQSEFILRQLEGTDPAHCFRRYICGLATGQLNKGNDDHSAILNLIPELPTNKSATFEYQIAASVGKTFKRLDACEEMYDCPLSGEEIDLMTF